jgi:glucose-6-phosphate isomerase
MRKTYSLSSGEDPMTDSKIIASGVQPEKNMTEVLIVGFGASSLNLRAIISSVSKTKMPFHYLDTLDPVAVQEILRPLNLNQTAIYIISKSGNTQETNILAEYLTTLETGKIFILCESKDTELYKIIQNIEHEWIDYANVKSGRFALLTRPFLDIATLAGVDTEKLIKAAESLNMSDAEEIANRWLENFKAAKANWVIITYTRQVYGLFMWVRQIISESLGKNGFGIFPILVEGTMDEHSQLQLFLDGPDDKFYDIISCDFHETGLEKLAQTQIDHSNKIFSMLQNKNRDTIHMHHQFIDESVVGQYIAIYTEAVKIIGEKMGFDPLTQPAVDVMKKCSYEN